MYNLDLALQPSRYPDGIFSMQKSNRILFLDFMRGFAVIFMVMGHSIDSVLSVHIRTSQGFILYDAIRGFTAPIFLFVSGYAYIVATERKWNEYRTFSVAAKKRLAKIVLLFVIGYALHSPYFSLNKILTHSGPQEYAQFFQVDVLHCVAASLLMLQLLLFVSPSRKVFAGLVLAVGTALVVEVMEEDTPYGHSSCFGHN